MNNRTADFVIAILQSKLQSNLIASTEADDLTKVYLRDKSNCIKEGIQLLAAVPSRNSSSYAVDILTAKVDQLKRADSFGNTETILALEEVIFFLKQVSH